MKTKFNWIFITLLCCLAFRTVAAERNGLRFYHLGQEDGLSHSTVFSINQDRKGYMWFATSDGLNKFNGYNFTVYRHAYGDSTSIASNTSRCIMVDGSGRIWVGTSEGLSLYDSDKERFVNYYISRKGKHVAVVNIVQMQRGKLLLGTPEGVFVFDIAQRQFLDDVLPQAMQELKNAAMVRQADRIYIGASRGLYEYAPHDKMFRQLAVLESSENVQTVFCQEMDRIWVATEGGGLFLYNKISKKLKNYYLGDESGLRSNFVRSLALDPDDQLWVGTYSGLYIFRENTGQFDLLSEQSESEGDLSQNSFSLSFVVPNYIARTHNTFSYKLDGYDKDWFELEDSRTVSYANLPAGVYVFYVKAANNDGKWNEEPASLRIEILPVWYRTWWATTLLVVVLVFLATGAFRFFWSRKSMQAAILMERKDREKMEEVNQMKIRFYVNISHELRTPLTLITAPLQDLLDHVSNYWEREKLTYIQRNTNRLLHLVNQLMDYRRAELGIFKLQLTRSNAYKRVLNCFLNYEHWVKKKDIDYNIYTELQDKDFLFDANYLDLILNNLLSNAVKYTEAGESITVKLYEEGEYLVLQVSDTGVGIPKDKQKKIFERFYQVDSDHPGSGIGLSLIQRLVELHHGRIDLKSEVGKGSTFTVYIPQNESAYTLEELQSNTGNSTEQVAYSTNANDAYVGETMDTDLSADAEDSEKKITILVVEDNEELRNYLVSGLRDLFNVTVAGNGQEALELLKDKEVDLVVTDVMMPVMDGIKLCRQLKQNLRTCHIPVFMLSAKTDVKYQLEGLKVGADDYLPKPFSMSVLRTKIQNTLRTRSRAFERYSNSTEVEPEKIAMNSMDEELLRKAIEVVERNMDNVEFSTEQFASEMNMSRSNLHLKLKAITGKSAIEFIHKIRFNRACQLLKEGKYSIAEISYMVGYNTPSYFAARFKKYMGCLPTEYIKKES